MTNGGGKIHTPSERGTTQHGNNGKSQASRSGKKS